MHNRNILKLYVKKIFYQFKDAYMLSDGFAHLTTPLSLHRSINSTLPCHTTLLHIPSYSRGVYCIVVEITDYTCQKKYLLFVLYG